MVDDGEICDICHYGYSEPGDMLVYCEKCNIPVHQSCYGIDTVPEGEWMCSVCKNNLCPTHVTCAICLKSGGAMHQTADHQWVHLICVFYTPELSLNLSGPEVLVEGLSLISKERAALCCSICKVSGGGCIQCSSRTCTTAYHPYCALKSGFILTSKEDGSGFQYVSYCKVHTEKKQNNRKNSTSESSSSRRKKRSPANKRKKQKNKGEVQSIPLSIIQRITPSGSGDHHMFCNDFWTLIDYYYVLHPNCNLILSQYRFFDDFSPLLHGEIAVPSEWIPHEYALYSQNILHNHLLEMSKETRTRVLARDGAFYIPELGEESSPIRKLSSSADDMKQRVTSFTPRNPSNSSLHHPKQQAFQGFDINDFADLRESYECSLNVSFIQWAQMNGVCPETTFRQATKDDIAWLLRINNINPTFSREKDYSGTFYEKNEFVIIAERTNPAGRVIPVGMVHYYLMWYYPCAGKVREAVRAVYVCTLQRVTVETHGDFCNWYSVDAEPLTGSMLLSLAFLHGRDCQMTMGCCDSTDNSVSFYTNQFEMTALPRGEGRHYTPMQLDLSSFNAYDTLIRHIKSPYRGTLLCSVEQPSEISFSIPEPINTTLHLQFHEDQLVSSVMTHKTNRDPGVLSYVEQYHPKWLTSSDVKVTGLDRSYEIINKTTGLYYHEDIPHFYEFSPSTQAINQDLPIYHSVYINEENRFTDCQDIERELEECQNELYKVVCSNEEAIARLVEVIISKEQESEKTMTLSTMSQQIHDELYQYTLEKRPEYVKAVEEDDYNDIICDVCGDGDSNIGNVILFCDGCNAAVHQDCYDVTDLPKGDWFCNVCEDILVNQLGVRDVLHITPQDANDTVSESGGEVNDLDNDTSACPILDKLHELRAKVHCCICGFSKGAMMPTMNKGQYAHLCCALWHPNCKVVNSHPLCFQPVYVPCIPCKQESGITDQVIGNSSMECEQEKTVYIKSDDDHASMECEQKNDVPSQPQPVCDSTANDDMMDIESTPAVADTVVSPASQSSEDVVLIPINPSKPDSPMFREPDPVATVTPNTSIPTNTTPDASTPMTTIPDASTPITTTPATSTPIATTLDTSTPASTTSDTPLEEYISPYARLRSHPDHNRYLIDISDLGNQRRSLTCQLCKRRGGVIPCCCSGCSRGVHASCAIKYELEMYWNNRAGKSHIPIEEVLVEKDYFIHCFIHSGGHQGQEVPRKHIDGYAAPLFCEMTTKKRQNDDYVVPVTSRRRPRRSEYSSSQDQGLQRMRMKRQRRKQREENHIKKQRSRSQQNRLIFTTKPRSLKEKKARRILEWFKQSQTAIHLLDNENNILLKLQKHIENGDLPRYANWTDYTVDNGTIESFYQKCKKRANPADIILSIREIYLSLLSYMYPSLDPFNQGIAKSVIHDAYDLTKLLYRIDNPLRYQKIVNENIPTYCVCMVTDGESDEFMVGCDGCGVWYHPFCIGYSTSKFYGFLSTYDQKYIDVREESSSCFFCPNCYTGENIWKMRLLSEEEVISLGGKRIEPDPEPEIQPVIESEMNIETEPVTQTVIESKMKVEAESETQPVIESEMKPEPEPETQQQLHFCIQSPTDSENRPELQCSIQPENGYKDESNVQQAIEVERKRGGLIDDVNADYDVKKIKLN